MNKEYLKLVKSIRYGSHRLDVGIIQTIEGLRDDLKGHAFNAELLTGQEKITFKCYSYSYDHVGSRGIEVRRVNIFNPIKEYDENFLIELLKSQVRNLVTVYEYETWIKNWAKDEPKWKGIILSANHTPLKRPKIYKCNDSSGGWNLRTKGRNYWSKTLFRLLWVNWRDIFTPTD